MDNKLIVFTFYRIDKDITKESEMEKVNILWTNAHPDLAQTMVFMYAINAKKQGWFDEVDIIIWGPTAKLVAEDESVQDEIRKAQEAGVKVFACSSCASMYGVVEKLQALGLEVRGMGTPLTQILKSNEKLITI